MKIILLEDIEKLGSTGEIVEVKDGFARNYLLPQAKALEATPENILIFQRKKEKEERNKEKQRQKALEFAEELSKISLTVACPAKENEELFGSVTPQMIVSALKEEGYEIDKDKIKIEEPIKKLGIYKVKIEIYPEVMAEVKLWVVKK
ncbi:MAG TPA: 50S ribosomal protein L9 [Candidatus Omnitrophica bacterium]|nr:MAG: 50S ribosomal protein L9 [Candidatus Omnitrophota bacterium]RKY45012.1 MAG: 50S ribosomal protein L9 [Candidatus Omnitrophota bacterium]HEC69475.1 50S ribosomal protein L9 [Candidatus Omnitrophota bacterium]